MPHDRRAAQAFEDAHLDLLRPHRHQPVKTAPKARHILPRQPHDEIRMHVDARLLAQEAQVVLQPHQILPAADVLRRRLIEGLNPHLKLHRARWEFADHLAQLLRQPVRHHLKVQKHPLAPAVQKEAQDRQCSSAGAG
jgi:hypothetical protein